MAAFFAMLVEGHADSETRPLFKLAQRAEIVGNFFRQHRDDAIREIDGVATELRFAIEL